VQRHVPSQFRTTPPNRQTPAFLAWIAVFAGLAAGFAFSGCATQQPASRETVSARLPAPGSTVRVVAATTLIEGAPFDLAIDGLAPGSTVRVHGRRTMQKWQQDSAGRWQQRPVIMHAWADLRANTAGRIDLSTATPSAGTWREPGAEALWWAGYPEGAGELAPAAAQFAGLPAPEPSVLDVTVTNTGGILARSLVRLAAPTGVTTQRVSQPGLAGVFAAPQNARGLPVIVLLHGSEGGKLASASGDAARFAAEGYAVLAITYFSWPWEAIPGTPNAHVNIAVETLERARTWLAGRPEADVNRFGVFGVSKGAEFAALAAATYPWIDAVVPCVGSDVVWEGYGVEPRPTPPPSSWSWRGEPVPAISLYPYAEVDPRWNTNAGRYDRSRADASPEERAAARIPIERSQASFLFIGGGRDEVWSSGVMSAAMQATLDASGQGQRGQTLIFERASHQICGSGLFPARLYATQANHPWSPDLDETGRATVAAWIATKAFFARTLQQSPSE
jgi:dienelactone hydrolase